MGKKKNKPVSTPSSSYLPKGEFSEYCLQLIRPWCWYCEREFEDEKGAGDVPCAHADYTDRFASVNAAPKGKTFQVRYVPETVEHGGWAGGSYPAGAQTRA